MPEADDPGSALLAPSIDQRQTTCPECGHVFSADTHANPDQTISTLLAVCDVLVVKALEKLGNEIVRGQKGRYNEFGNRPYHLAHTVPGWQPDDAMISKILKNAWHVVPLLLDTHGSYDFDAAVAVAVLDKYVHDLAVTGSEHDVASLAYRLRAGLGLPVFHIAQSHVRAS